MSEDLEKKEVSAASEEEQYSLNDDRRVKVLSPGAMVAKRFFRNRIAVVGLCILAFMFIFSFIGGIISPYKENQQFYRIDIQNKEYAGAVKNSEFRYVAAPDQKFDSIIQAQVVLATTKKQDTVTYRDVTYGVIEEGKDFYRVTLADTDTTIGLAYKDIVTPSVEGTNFSYDFIFNALKAYTNDGTSFTADGKNYVIDEDGGVFSSDGDELAFISRYVIQTIVPGQFLSRAFQEELAAELEAGADSFVFTDVDGVESEYIIDYKPDVKNWKIRQATETRVYDTYGAPSREHWLGTDRNGSHRFSHTARGSHLLTGDSSDHP